MLLLKSLDVQGVSSCRRLLESNSPWRMKNSTWADDKGPVEMIVLELEASQSSTFNGLPFSDFISLLVKMMEAIGLEKRNLNFDNVLDGVGTSSFPLSCCLLFIFLIWTRNKCICEKHKQTIENIFMKHNTKVKEINNHR